MKVFLDYGHGGSDPGAVSGRRRESMDNLRLGRKLACYLRGLGLEVVQSRQDDSYLSLDQRVRLANTCQPDLFLSLHRNAFRPNQAAGVEIFKYSYTNRLGTMPERILKRLGYLGFKNRGLKDGDFYVLRKTYCPALLIELGFIDNYRDNLLFDRNIERIAFIIAQEIYFYLEGGK